MAGTVKEPYYLEVPRWFVIPGKKFGILALTVVVDKDRDEFGFDGFDD